MKKQTIRLNEAQLNSLIKESIKSVLTERKPSDRTIGKHTFKGLRYDKNGNPLYTSDTLSDEEKKAQGWKYSKKHGLHGQISDPTKLTESQLISLIKESVKKVLKEDNKQSWANTLIDAIANDEETLGYFDDRFLYSKEYSQSEAPIARQWGEMDEYEKAEWILQNSDTRALVRDLRRKGLISKLTEARNLIDFTTSDIWSKYNIPWNEVDDNPEEYQGLWHISFNVFDYTYCMGTIDIDETFSSLEECLTFVQNLTYEEIFDYIEENVSSLNDESDLEYVSERISAVSFNILCKTQNGDYEVANTRPYSPKL